MSIFNLFGWGRSAYRLGDGDDWHDNWDGNDSQTVYGGAGSDIINGGNRHDLFFGEAGNDCLSGGGGHDTLSGGDGSDALDGGDGRDLMFGGDGDDLFTAAIGDVVFGGTGQDVFDVLFRPGDHGIIMLGDFTFQEDIINLHGLGAGTQIREFGNVLFVSNELQDIHVLMIGSDLGDWFAG